MALLSQTAESLVRKPWLFCSVLLVATAFALRRRTLQPLAIAVEAAQRVASGDLTGQMEIVGRDEAAMLMSALHHMNESLSRLVNDARQDSGLIAESATTVRQESESGAEKVRYQSDAVGSISSTIVWLLVARALVACTSMPAVTLRQQLGARVRSPLISTTQARQLPSGRKPSL